MKNAINVEVLVASPPTKYCDETLGVLEEIIHRHPDELRLIVYKRGIDLFPEGASQAMKTMMQKGSRVPVVIVNGGVFSTCKVPVLENLEKKVQEVLLRIETE